MKMSQKLSRVILYTFVVLFLSTLVFLYMYISKVFTEQQTEILTLNRDLAVEEIQGEFSDIGEVVYTLASSIRLDPDSTDLRTLLIDIEENNNLITQMFVGFPDSSFVLTSDFTPPPGFDITTRPWYLKALESTDVSYTDAYLDAVEERIVMTVVYPVYDESDTLLAVIGADIEVDSITSFIQTLASEEGGFAFVLDGNGNVLAHTFLDQNSTALTTYDEYGIPYSSINIGQGVTDTITVLDESGKIAYQTIPESGFIVGIFMTSQELKQSTGMLSIISIAAISMIFFSVIVIFVIYNNYIHKPLKGLINDINSIDMTNNPDFRLDSSKRTGFHQARIALNKLIDISGEYQKQLQSSMGDLNLEIQKFESLLQASSDTVFVIDKDQRYVNVYGDKIYLSGANKGNVIGRTHREIFGDRYAKEREEQYALALEGEFVLYSWGNEYEGKTYYFETVVNPIFNQDGEVIGAVGVARDITEQENRFQEMLYISTHDYLTDLYNRKFYYDKMTELNDRREYPFTVINVDVNGLKIINDAFGHEVGDQALIKTANILKKAASKEFAVCRVSGDEFSVIMPDSDQSVADEFKKTLLSEFRNTQIKNMNLSVAIGYYVQVDHNTTLDEVRKRAENDMYRQKILERKSVKNKAISAILKTLTDKYEAEKLHSNRVSKISIQIGQALELDSESLKMLSTAAMFHDIGKISLPDEILNKPGKLTKEEYEIVKTHTTIGYDILHTADQYSELAIHASSHHERWDGLGYPNGLIGTQIPLFSRIICIADAYEAMTSDRPYRKSMSKEAATQEIIDNAGTQFDPDIAKIFVEQVLKREWDE